MEKTLKIQYLQHQLGIFADNKIKFLIETYSDEKTQVAYFGLFKLYVVSFEQINNKDYIEFTNEQKDDVIESIPTPSFRTQKQVLSLLKIYENWAINNGLNKTGVNYTENISTRYLNKFIQTKSLERKFMTKEDIHKIESILAEKSSMADELLSGQYFLCLLLPFYGIYGHACDEITNLTKYDVDFENKIVKVLGKKGYREVDVDDFLLKYLNKAINEVTLPSSFRVEPLELADINNILKSAIIPKYEGISDGTLSRGGIWTRLKKILDEYEKITNDISIQKVTLISIKASGKISKLREMEKEKGFLDAKDFKKINELFGDKPNSYFGLKEDYYAITRVD